MAKGNVLDDGKPGAFGAMAAFLRICFGQSFATAPSEARRGDEARMTRSRGCARVAKGNGL